MKNILIIIFIACLYAGCHKTYDLPPLKTVNDGARITVTKMKERCPLSNSYFRFSEGDTNLYCTVTMDETSGNLYKQVFLSDDEGMALSMKLVNSGGLFTGDKIRINLNSCWLVSANSMIYLDSIDLEKSVVKLSSGSAVNAKVTSVAKITGITDAQDAGNLQSQLVELNNVEFITAARGKPFANAIGRTAFEYMLTDCTGKEIAVRTSGMSNFAAKLTPAGNGKLVGVVQQYNNELTLLIRNYNELQMSNTPCTTAPPTTVAGSTYLYKDFNDNDLRGGNWQVINAAGTTSWTSSNLAQSSYYARIYNKTGTVYEACESWLISPEVDLTAAKDPVISFLTANSSTASPLSLMVSKNYVQGSPALAAWTEIPFPVQKSSFTFFPSGEIALAAYKGNKVRIGYKYSGTVTTGSIWNLDNIVVKEK